MSDETTPEHPSHPAQPAPAKAPSLTDAEANRQLSQGAPPHATTVPEARQAPDRGVREPEAAPRGVSQTVKVGARDVDRPSVEDDDGSAGGDGSLYDRLAKKDNTNAGPGGQSGAA